MAPSIETHATPELIRWARQIRHLPKDTAAKRLKIDLETLDAWETGRSRPTLAKLAEIAEVYRKPLAVFFLESPPEAIELPADFRKGAEYHLMSPELYDELVAAHARRETALELMFELKRQPVLFEIMARLDEDVENLSRRLRKAIQVPFSEQTRSKNRGDGALPLWKTAIENVGVLVFQMSKVDPGLARGFSISESEFPVIAINSKDARNGRVFSLLHEFVHVALRRGGLCGEEASGDVEVFCNRVAAAVLLPVELLETQSDLPRSQHEWTPARFAEFARLFGVSEFALIRRLLELGLINQEQYSDHVKIVGSRRANKESGAPPYALVKVAQLGRPYVRLIFDAYDSGLITPRDASVYLGKAKLGSFDDIRKQARR